MTHRTMRIFDEESFLSLLLLLLAGTVAHLLISPGSVLTNIPEVIVPLVISAILLGFMYRISRRGYDEIQLKQIIRFGWVGALGAASTGFVWVILNLSRKLPIVSLSNEMITGISVGTAVGIFGGWYSLQAIQQDTQVDAFGSHPEQIVAESTWTHQSHPNPILTEIITQIAELDGVDPLSMTPVSECIPPDMLAELAERTDTTWQFAFQMEQYEIHVSSYGTVTVYETDYGEDKAAGDSISPNS